MSHDDLRRPPSSDGLGVGSLLALLVHGLLVAALAWGVHWKRSEVAAVSAELWSAVPQLADAAGAAAPPEAPVRPEPAPPPPPPRPAPRPEPRPVPQAAERDADIATAQRKKREEAARAEEARKAREKEREEEARRDKDKEREKQRREKEKEREQAEKAKAEREKTRAEEARKDAVRKQDEARRKEEETRQAKADAARAQKLRQEQLQRMNDQLGGGGSAGSGSGGGQGAGGGKAARASAPSAGYAGRIRARVLPNIVYTAEISGNPAAEVEVRLSSDGRILGTRLIRSSGVPGWDQAVLRALERTEVLPADVDGQVPSPMVLTFRPDQR